MAFQGLDKDGAAVTIQNPPLGPALKAASFPFGIATDDPIYAALAALGTQTTAAAILAKLSADPATQTTLAAVLAKLSADPATQTTLAAVLAAVTGTLIVGGAVADGSAPTSNAVSVSGIDPAGNKRTFATDLAGRAVASGGINTGRLLSAAASTNATSVKGSAGYVKQLSGYNASSAAKYLKLYDKASAPTVGTDTPRKTVYLPPLAPFVIDCNDYFATGIAYALTGAAADADTTALAAGDILCLNVDYN